MEPQIRIRQRLVMAAILRVRENEETHRGILFMGVMAGFRLRRFAGNTVFGIKLAHDLIERCEQTNHERPGQERQIVGVHPQIERIPGGKDPSRFGRTGISANVSTNGHLPHDTHRPPHSASVPSRVPSSHSTARTSASASRRHILVISSATCTIAGRGFTLATGS